MFNTYSKSENEQQNSFKIDRLIREMIEMKMPDIGLQKKKKKSKAKKILKDDRKFLT
jgi:hypothetical protein